MLLDGPMREKTWRAMFMGHEIVVRNVFGLNKGNIVTEAQLVIDEAIVARTFELSARKAVLCATLIDRDNSHAVEVLFGGIFTLRMKILVDGRKIFGDLK
jgi:hypothetical protein